MKSKRMKHWCIDGTCNWEETDCKMRDALKCPKCGGPTCSTPDKYRPSKRALFVRGEMLKRCKFHCFKLTPQQVDTVLSIGDEYRDKGSKSVISKPVREKETPLLQIELTDINSVPVVFYKGERIDFKARVSFDYKTDNSRETNPNYIHIEYHDDEGGGINTKTIQHNHPICEEEILDDEEWN
jgi:hypothetical protein